MRSEDKVLDERGTHNKKKDPKSERRTKVLLYKRFGNKRAKQVDRRSRILG